MKRGIAFLLIIALDAPALAAEFTLSVVDATTSQPIAARVYLEHFGATVLRVTQRSMTLRS